MPKIGYIKPLIPGKEVKVTDKDILSLLYDLNFKLNAQEERLQKRIAFISMLLKCILVGAFSSIATLGILIGSRYN